MAHLEWIGFKEIILFVWALILVLAHLEWIGFKEIILFVWGLILALVLKRYK